MYTDLKISYILTDHATQIIVAIDELKECWTLNIPFNRIVGFTLERSGGFLWLQLVTEVPSVVPPFRVAEADDAANFIKTYYANLYNASSNNITVIEDSVIKIFKERYNHE